ncbi:MAG: GNAT family N-acetyltransferase [Candidatus Cloacimonetes bacterium]|nr:GNAT family N-acetyltransferase [Candidatus Cloacimonadota bacterium]
MTKVDKKLRTVKVDTLKKVEVMREIYNQNLDMLGTVALPYRSVEEQVQWWKENKQYLRAYLFEPLQQPGEYVGFITLTDRGSFATPILAVNKKAWGKGYGSEMIKAYLKLAHKPLAGSQLVSNDAIRHMNKKNGWIVVGYANSPNGALELVYHPGVSAAFPGTPGIQAIITRYLFDKYQGSAYPKQKKGQSERKE